MPFSTVPLSLYSIPAAWLCAYYPASYKNRLIGRTIGYNNRQPRDELKRLEAKNPEVFKKVSRIYGAHANGLEIFPLWTAAVLAGHVAGLSDEKLNIFSIIFIGLRLIYNTIYISDKGSKILNGFLRTFVWFSSTATAMTLLFMAAATIRAKKD